MEEGSIGYKLGEGKSIPFWFASWYYFSPFAKMFHDFIASSRTKDASMTFLGFCREGMWNWADFSAYMTLLL